MSRTRFLPAVMMCMLAVAGIGIAPELVVTRAHAAEQAKGGDAIRPEVGVHLQAAQELLKTHKFKEALAKIRDADAVSDKTPHEAFIIERMRAAAASMAGDTETAIKASEAVIASGLLPPADQLTMIQGIAGTAYRGKDYAKTIIWAQRYFKEGGTELQMRTMLAQAYYLGNDFDSAARELQASVQAAEKAGKAPPEDLLQLWANACLQAKDSAAYVRVLEKLVTYYPKKDYWADLLSRTQRRPGFGERLALDVLRLKFATGTIDGTADYMEAVTLALQAGFPAEAKKAVDLGFSSGALGTGPEAERHKRLRDLVARQFAEDLKSLAQPGAESGAISAHDGNVLVNLGWAYVSNGDFTKGIALMEQGIRKGVQNDRPEDAKLHLGVAYVLAGQKAKAVEMFTTVTGKHGAADMGRLWGIT